MTGPERPAWVADPGVAWNILLTARPTDAVSDQQLVDRLALLYAERSWGAVSDLVADSDVVALQQRLTVAAGESVPVVVGRAGTVLVVAAHHSHVDGLGLLGVLATLLDVPVTSSAGGVRERAGPARHRAMAARLAEVVFAPPAPVQPSHPSSSPELDTFATLTLPGSFRTADLVHAGVAGVAAFNDRRGARRRHLTVAVGASTRSGENLEIVDRSALIRLRDVEGVSRDDIAQRLRRAPLQVAAPTGSALGRVTGLALRLLAPRLGSTLLVSHLGDVTCPGVEDLGFSPVTGGGSGVSLGAVGHDGRTTLTMRARGRTHDADGLREVLEAVGIAASH